MSTILLYILWHIRELKTQRHWWLPLARSDHVTETREKEERQVAKDGRVPASPLADPSAPLCRGHHHHQQHRRHPILVGAAMESKKTREPRVRACIICKRPRSRFSCRSCLLVGWCTANSTNTHAWLALSIAKSLLPRAPARGHKPSRSSYALSVCVLYATTA